MAHTLRAHRDARQILTDEARPALFPRGNAKPHGGRSPGKTIIAPGRRVRPGPEQASAQAIGGTTSATRTHVVTGGAMREFLADQGIHFAYPFMQLEHRRGRPLAEIADPGIELIDNGIHLFDAFHAKPFTFFVELMMIQRDFVTFDLFRISGKS